MQVIFDLDGTLLETERYALVSARRTAQELGCDAPSRTQLRAAIGLPLPQYLAALFPGADIECLTPVYLKLENTELRRHASLFPGVVDLLHQLKADGISTAICSNGQLPYVEQVIELTGIRRLIDRPTSARGFPSKAEALALLVDLDPKSIMVGDTGIDIEAALANDIPSVACLYGYGDPAELAAATCLARTPAEVLPAVRQCLPIAWVSDPAR